MISCQVCWRIIEMAQRSNRRFLNLISEEVLQAVTLIRKRAGGIHHGQESPTPPKAEYIGADRTSIPQFSLVILRRTIHTDNDDHRDLDEWCVTKRPSRNGTPLRGCLA